MLPDADTAKARPSVRSFIKALTHTPRVLKLVARQSPKAVVAIFIVSGLSALIAPAAAYIGKLIVDGVVAALNSENPATGYEVLPFVAAEFGIVLLGVSLGRARSLLQSLIGAELGYAIQMDILKKANTLSYEDFENPRVYDQLQNARREAGARPLSLFMSLVDSASNTITLISFAVILFGFHPLVLLILVVASVPGFLVEAKFSDEAFKIFSWRAPKSRRMRYLEWLMTRDQSVREVKLYDLAPGLTEEYQGIYKELFAEERSLAIRRNSWGLVFQGLATTTLYGTYAWIAYAAVKGQITLGDLTLYLTVFRQGQTLFRQMLQTVGKAYEDNLFMSNLFKFLDRETPTAVGAQAPSEKPLTIQFEDVSFKYPGAKEFALENFTLTITPGEKIALVGENGAGKTTLIKLLVGLYTPTSGRILIGGEDVTQIDKTRLHRLFAVVLQDFVRYQFTADRNIWIGDTERAPTDETVKHAAEASGILSDLEQLPAGLKTQLGRWFEGGVELSTGQWQRVATGRAFYREGDILILDEPSAALDAQAEYDLFERFKTLAKNKTAILISHRFSTVRQADRIVVLNQGKKLEEGTHAELMAKESLYRHLFSLQAKGYAA